jgi:hypothetical protein
MQIKIDLNEQLNRYATNARGQIAQGRGFGEYAGYAAAVGAGLALAGGADAAIIYSGVQNVSVQINPAWQATQTSSGLAVTHLLDINQDGVADVLLSMSANVGTRAGRTYYQIGGFFHARNGAALLNTQNSSSNIAAGAMIGPGGQFGPWGAFHSGFWSTRSGHSSPGPAWNLNTSGLVGIRLGNGDYGWIHLRFDDLGLNQPYSTLLGGATLQDGQGFPDRMTVVDWAYQDSGGAIAAGDTGASPIPEPSSLALLAAGAAGLAGFRRRKANATVMH